MLESPFYGITGTPHLWVDFLRHGPPTQKATLNYLTISGGQLPLKHFRNLRERFPAAKILRTYGQTETFRTFVSENIDGNSFDAPIAGVSAEFVNREPPGTEQEAIAELVHYGTGTMLGYFDDLEASAEKFVGHEKKGVRTGDYFRKAADGRFYFYGRKDDLTKRFEQRFSLGAVQNILNDHPDVEEAVALLKPAADVDPRQQILGVFVRTKTASKLSEADLLTFCKHHLPYYSCPDFVRKIDSFPLTVSGKIDLVALQMRFSNELAPTR